MVTNPVLLPDYDGRRLSAWTLGFPTHPHSDSDATLVGKPTSFHILRFLPLPFHRMVSPPIQNGEGHSRLYISPAQGTSAQCMGFDNQEILMELSPRIQFELSSQLPLSTQGILPSLPLASL